ncbi:hypothetical protein CLV59_102689 [Chitinophaga dinghuensis]|uniref:Uncharacterized protein n=1 Tax=Chitinophaga dinghuensis TaxID=1539050 RepID=A0A327W9T4_9BACT|nr:hypothetical protein CLV59_102689 [Chitinophaga dinghuensis]
MTFAVLNKQQHIIFYPFAPLRETSKTQSFAALLLTLLCEQKKSRPKACPKLSNTAKPEGFSRTDSLVCLL